jgi:RimJ/RimL family protein N-acetyltransferase
MCFTLQQLSVKQLQLIAVLRVPAELTPRLVANALPPSFVAARALALLAQGKAEQWCRPFLIVRRSDERIVGSCGFKDAPHGGRIDIGYGVAESCTCQGAATAAVGMLIALAFNAGLEVLAEVNPDNVESTRVVQKAQFRQIGARVDLDGEHLVQWLASSK